MGAFLGIRCYRHLFVIAPVGFSVKIFADPYELAMDITIANLARIGSGDHVGAVGADIV